EDNALEKELKNIISQVISNDKVPVNVPLEYAGLTSIGTIRLSTAVYKRFGINIPVKNFKGMTLFDLENMILENWLNGANISEEQEISDNKTSPLSPAQMGVYVDCMKNQESTAYNIPAIMEFTSDTDTEKLANAVKSVVKAHPSMDIHFEMSENEVVAVKNNTENIEVPVIEMTEEVFLSYRDKQSVPFRLNKGALYRFAVIKTEKAVYLFMDVHHLIFDGFSMNLFIKELGTVLSGGKPAGEKSYFDFVRESKIMLERDSAEYDRYFSEILADFDSATELTPDLPATDKKGKKAYIYGSFNQNGTDRICKKLKVTEAGFFLAALDYTLARLTASEKVYISTISSGRSDIRFADTFGMFVNTLPLYAALDSGNIYDFVKKVTKGLDNAVSHENYPFAELAAKWGCSVNIMYEYQRGIVENTNVPNMTGIKGLEPDTAKFPVTLRIVDKNGTGAIECEYSDTLYSEKFIREFVRSYEIVIEKFLSDGKLREVTLIDSEREKQLEIFRNGSVMPPIPENTFFQTGLETTAEKYPDKTALYAADGVFTFREFDQMANRAANYLLSRASEGDRVVVLLPRTSKTMFTIFGILKAGMAFIPCDPNYPTDRIKHIIDDSDAPLVITTADKAEAYGNRAVIVDELFENNNTTKPEIHITGENLAYLIYTSGSTGKPKGVMIRHRNAVDYFTDHPDKVLCHAMVTDGSVVNSITTLSFDVSIKEYGNAFFNGLAVAFAGDEEINNADKLAKFMRKSGADVFISTPSRLLTLMESPAFAENIDNCRVVVCAGEKYPEKLMSLMQTKNCRLINTYGPTEITVSSNESELTNADKVTVGRPMPNVVEYIVDSDGNELPVGVVGELYIGGPGVGAGYNNLDEMTAERFIEYKGGRIYKSGDFARWADNGDVEILGRKDNQIKLRG
ncbi:MAG: amino acid adenylation domain-containing protein, partial [Ruminococcus sp.]|nr:amino acid adenylation domain-containing protein [Ruminococcus sp.]